MADDGEFGGINRFAIASGATGCRGRRRMSYRLQIDECLIKCAIGPNYPGFGDGDADGR